MEVNISSTVGEELPGGSRDVIIESVRVGTSLVVNGNSGDDKFIVGGGDYDNNIRGPVTTHGNSGLDKLEIDDKNDRGNDETYILTRRLIDG